MKKKIILLAMVMLAMFALCACVRNNGNDDDDIAGTPGLLFTEILDAQSNVIGYSVSKGTAATGGAVIIPEHHKNKPVIAIANNAFQECKLTSITIPASVTSIGNGALNACFDLKTVTFGANSQLESIGDFAFHECFSLESITIPSGVKSFGDRTFKSCSALKTVIFEEYSQLEGIGNGTFFGCTSLESIIIPTSVTSISDLAFFDCTSLKSIIISSGVKIIGDWTFESCSALETVTFERSVSDGCVTAIGSDPFNLCNMLTTIYVPADSVNAYKSELYGKISEATVVAKP